MCDYYSIKQGRATSAWHFLLSWFTVYSLGRFKNSLIFWSVNLSARLLSNRPIQRYVLSIPNLSAESGLNQANNTKLSLRVTAMTRMFNSGFTGKIRTLKFGANAIALPPKELEKTAVEIIFYPK